MKQVRVEKIVVSLYLSKELMEQARNISDYSGVPISRLAEKALRKELKRFEAVKLLEGENVQ